MVQYPRGGPEGEKEQSLESEEKVVMEAVAEAVGFRRAIL